MSTINIIKYKHFGRDVFTNEDLKGMNREHCLCYKCDRFAPDTPRNCRIAQETYQNCVKWGLITPVYACPAFIEAIEPLDVLQQIESEADYKLDANDDMYVYIAKLRTYLENEKDKTCSK